jgi:phytoene synthase
MQLTNILRDIKEDFQRGRVYLPKDEMQHFKISESDISSQKLDENFKALLRFQIERTRRYYAESMPGIKFIGDFSSRFVILAMKEMYSKILDSIEKNNYDIFSKRAHVNNFGKILTAFNVFLKGKYR